MSPYEYELDEFWGKKGKARRAKRRAEGRTLKDKINNLKSKVPNPAVALLVPFHRLMKKQLEKIGVSGAGNMDPKTLVTTFYNSVVKKKDDFAYSVDDLDPVTFGAIASAVFKFIKDVIERKKKAKLENPSSKDASAAEFASNSAKTMLEATEENASASGTAADALAKRAIDSGLFENTGDSKDLTIQLGDGSSGGGDAQRNNNTVMAILGFGLFAILWGVAKNVGGDS